MNNTFFEELEKNDNSNSGLKKETYSSSVNGTEKNINYFLLLAKVIRIISYIFAGIVFLIGLIIMQESSESFVICLISSIVLVIIAILSTPFLEWKAYMLKTIYEINKSIKGKK